MGTVVLPAIIVAAVGLIAGIILTIAAKLMFVPVDERVAAIEEVLPGANCGACGFAGCSDYAKALGNDADVSTSLCPVGGAAVASQIAEIMGVAGGDVDPKIAMVMCKGTLEATRQIEELDRIHSCKSAKMFYGGNWACPYGCLGMGDCADACQFDAIRVVDGVAQIDRDKCVGCEACMSSLTRVMAGGFSKEQALTLEKIKELADKNELESSLISIDTALGHFPKVIASNEFEKQLKNGNAIGSNAVLGLQEASIDVCSHDICVRLYLNNNGLDEFIGVYHLDKSSRLLKPVKIFYRN